MVNEKVIDLPIAGIVDRGFNVRSDLGNIRNLAKSINVLGQITPAIVRSIKGGKYECTTGHRRKEALKSLGMSTMRCIIRDMTDKEAYDVVRADNELHLRLGIEDRFLDIQAGIRKGASDEDILIAYGETSYNKRMVDMLRHASPKLLAAIDPNPGSDLDGGQKLSPRAAFVSFSASKSANNRVTFQLEALMAHQTHPLNRMETPKAVKYMHDYGTSITEAYQGVFNFKKVLENKNAGEPVALNMPLDLKVDVHTYQTKKRLPDMGVAIRDILESTRGIWNQ